MSDFSELIFELDKMAYDLGAATGVTMVQRPKLKTVTVENLDGTTTTTEYHVKNESYDPSEPTEVDPISGKVTSNGPYEYEEVPVVGAYSCEALQLKIDEYVKVITDLIASKVQTIANIMSDWGPMMTLPSDPLKILTWAAKVVGGPAATQIALVAHIITDIALLATKVAGMATAAANAAAQLAACVQGAIIGAIEAVINELLEGTAVLIGKAESLMDQIISDNLTAIGADELISQISSIEDSISDISDAMGDLQKAGDAISSAADTIGDIQAADFGDALSVDLPGDLDSKVDALNRADAALDSYFEYEASKFQDSGKNTDPAPPSDGGG